MSTDPPRTRRLVPHDAEREARLAGHFVSLAGALVTDDDVVDLLDRLVHACVDLLDLTSAGLLLTGQDGKLQLMASTSEESRLLELYQVQSDEGPCMDSIHRGEPVTVEDLRAAPGRWPRFEEAARMLGYRAVHALPLRLKDEVLGGINLFRTDPTPFTAAERDIAQALADVATVGLLQQRSAHRAAVLSEQLQRALGSRVVIEQAKGVLAEHGRLSMDHAFQALRRYARNGNRKLSDVSHDVVRGALPLDDLVLLAPS